MIPSKMKISTGSIYQETKIEYILSLFAKKNVAFSN